MIINNEYLSINGYFAQSSVFAIATTGQAALCSKINPRNISYMPVVNFLVCLDLEQNISSLDRYS